MTNHSQRLGTAWRNGLRLWAPSGNLDCHPRRLPSIGYLTFDQRAPRPGIDAVPVPPATGPPSVPADEGHLVAAPVLGGLQHDYRLAA